MTEKPENILLAVESAIRGGSIALFRDGREISRTAGNTDVSRAEDLLGNISDILSRNGFTATDLDSIAISTGPGSFTGIRIGIATVLGLRTALGIDCFGVSVMAAMAASLGSDKPAAAVIPIGKNEAAWQAFRSSEAVTEAASGDIGTVISAAAAKCGGRVVFHEHIADTFRETIENSVGKVSLENICTDPAVSIAEFALREPSARLPLEPFYLQNPRHKGLGVG